MFDSNDKSPAQLKPDIGTNLGYCGNASFLGREEEMKRLTNEGTLIVAGIAGVGTLFLMLVIMLTI